MKKIFKIYAIRRVWIDEDERRYALDYVAERGTELEALSLCNDIQTKTVARHSYYAQYYDEDLTILPVYIKA